MLLFHLQVLLLYFCLLNKCGTTWVNSGAWDYLLCAHVNADHLSLGFFTKFNGHHTWFARGLIMCLRSWMSKIILNLSLNRLLLIDSLVIYQWNGHNKTFRFFHLLSLKSGRPLVPALLDGLWLLFDFQETSWNNLVHFFKWLKTREFCSLCLFYLLQTILLRTVKLLKIICLFKVGFKLALSKLSCTNVFHEDIEGFRVSCKQLASLLVL